MSIADKLTLCS